MKVYYVIFLIVCTNNLFSQNSVLKELYGFRMSTSFIFFDVQDTSFTDNVVALDPKLLCFPGGFGNFYHLKGSGYGVNPAEVAGYNKGVKAKLARSLNAISRKKGHDKNYIYDFIKLAKKTQSKVIFNINILNEPVEDYLKVIEIFKEHDLDIIAVELGGELYTREYKDVIMTYGTVGVKEDVDMDQATLSFNYTILDPATHTIDELNKDEVFKDYLGDVLRYIIMDSLEWGKENNLARIGIGNDESTTDSDT